MTGINLPPSTDPLKGPISPEKKPELQGLEKLPAQTGAFWDELLTTAGAETAAEVLKDVTGGRVQAKTTDPASHPPGVDQLPEGEAPRALLGDPFSRLIKSFREGGH